MEEPVDSVGVMNGTICLFSIRVQSTYVYCEKTKGHTDYYHQGVLSGKPFSWKH